MGKHTHAYAFTCAHTHTQHHNYFVVTRAGFHDNRRGGGERERKTEKDRGTYKERKKEINRKRERSDRLTQITEADLRTLHYQM